MCTSEKELSTALVFKAYVTQMTADYVVDCINHLWFSNIHEVKISYESKSKSTIQNYKPDEGQKQKDPKRGNRSGT